MPITGNHRVHAHRVRRSVEHRIRQLANRHASLAITLGPIIVVVGLATVLVRLAVAIAVKAVIFMCRLTIAITLVICLNVFRTFPG